MSHKNNTNYPIHGTTPIEADIKTHQKNTEFKVPVTKTTATGGTVFDHHDTINTNKDQIVHKGDKQPTELHEPAAEKNYKLRDDEKDYEFKPRTEATKTKDSKMKVWEEKPSTKEHHYQNVHEHGNLGVHEHGIHVHEHDRDQKEHPILDKLKDAKENVKEKIKERKDRKEKKDHASKIDGEHKVHELKHHEERVKPEYERTDYTRTEANLYPEYTKELPYVSVGKGPVEIHDPLRPAEIHEPEYTKLPHVSVGKGPVEIHDPKRPVEIH